MAAILALSVMMRNCYGRVLFADGTGIGALRIVISTSRGTGSPVNLRMDLRLVMKPGASYLMRFLSLIGDAYNLQQYAFQRQRLAAEDYRCVWKGRSCLAHCGTTAICQYHGRADYDRMVSSVLFLTVEEWSHRMGDVGRKIAREEEDFG